MSGTYRLGNIRSDIRKKRPTKPQINTLHLHCAALVENYGKDVKVIWTFILLTVFLWSSVASAEYCNIGSGDKETSCIYKINRIPKNTQIIISYTQQGWSMLIVVFLDDFAMIEGDAQVKTKNGETQSIEYVSTRRDMTGNRMMEAALYLVSEQQLHELGRAKGKIRFYLAATGSKKDVEVEVASSNFEDIDAYISETKTLLGDLFKDQ
ncbi:MAG TPA: hypothetical protein VIS57_00930 [Xanthomonadales bacterium]